MLRLRPIRPSKSFLSPWFGSRTRGGSGAGGAAGRAVRLPPPSPRPKAPASPDPFRAEERRGRLDELELPTIEVRGLIEIEGRPPAALIRVGTYSHVAVKGDSLSLSAKLLGGRGPSEQRVELEVLSVSKAGLRLRHRESNKELLYR